MVIPLHGVAGSTRRDPDTTAKSYNYCDATANRHGHAVVSNDIAFSRSAVTHRRSSAVMTATMNPRFVRPAPSALGPAHTPRIAGREPGVAHTSDTKTPCRAQNTISEPHTTASRNRPPLRRTHCDGAGGPSQGATSHPTLCANCNDQCVGDNRKHLTDQNQTDPSSGPNIRSRHYRSELR